MLVINTPIPVITGPAGLRRAPISVEWHRARMHMMAPFGWDFQEYYVDGETVDDARNKASHFCTRRNDHGLY